MDRLRIAAALPHLGVYGGIRRFLELGRVWAARGHEVALAIPNGAGSGRAWLPFPGRIVALENLSAERWDLLLSPDPQLFLSTPAPGALRVFYAVLEKAPGAQDAWVRADLVLANSSGMVAHLARHGVTAVPAIGGVNLNAFRPPVPDPRRDAGSARARGPVRVLVYGRLSRRRKGTLVAAKAVDAASRRARVPVELTLFDSPLPGDPADEPRLPLAIPHRWALHPTQEELAALYGDADIFVSAERRAGWCNTAAEAMACGAAVVCTRSGTEDFAVDRETALVSRWRWSWSLAGPVAALLRDPALRRKIAEAGRARVETFPWERTAETIERAVLRRLGRSVGPSQEEVVAAVNR